MSKSNSINEPLVIEPSWAEDNPEPTLRETLCSCALWRVILYAVLAAFSSELVNIVSPILGAEFFNDNSDSSCDSSANSTYAWWSGVSTGFGGFLGFLSQGYVGKLADIYGRKKLLIWVFIINSLTYGISLTFFQSYFWIYLFITPLGDCMAGSFGGIPTVLQASMADIIPPIHRTILFGVVFGCAGLAVIVSAILTDVLENIYGINGVIYAFDILIIFRGIYVIFIYKETLSEDKQEANSEYYRKETTLARESDLENHNNIIYYIKRLFEPLWPLLKIRKEPILFGIGMISLFTALPEAGLDDIISSYLLDVLQLCTETDATNFESLTSIIAGIGLMITLLIILPLLIKCINDIGLFFIGLMSVVLLLSSGIVIYFFPYNFVGYILYGLLAITYINPPIATGALSKRLDEKEQGIGIGILHAIKGLTWGVAPVLFAALYAYFDDYGWLKTMPFIFGTVFVLCGLPIWCCPLRNALNNYDDKQLRIGKAPLSAIDGYSDGQDERLARLEARMSQS